MKTATHAILSPYAVYLHVYMYKVWGHLPGDPQSVQLRNATTILSPYAMYLHVYMYKVWVHLPGDPQSVQMRNATTTPTYLQRNTML